MKTLSLILSLIGIFLLFSILIFSTPIPINNPSQLNNLIENEKVQTQGKVIKQTSSLIILDNNLTFICQNCRNFKNQIIQITGTITKYKNKTQIQTLSINPLD